MNNTTNYRIFVEKLPRFRVEAESLRRELNTNLNLSLGEVRLLCVYDLFGFSEELLEKSRYTVFGEVVTDSVTDTFDLAGRKYIAVEYLPGQFDQRAASAVDCVRLIDPEARVDIRSSRLLVFDDKTTDGELAKIRHYYINAVESREKDLSVLSDMEQAEVKPVGVLEGFREMADSELEPYCKTMGLAMNADDLREVVKYFRSEGRDPYETELRILDTYWSDHCRHTTFTTELEGITVEESFVKEEIEDSLALYLRIRRELGREHKSICLMDMATIGAKALKKAIREADTAIENLWKAIEQGQAVEMLTDRLNKRMAEKVELEAQLAIEENKKITLTEAQILAFLDYVCEMPADDVNKRRAIINIFVHSIYLYDDHFTLIINASKKPLSIDNVPLDDIETAFESETGASEGCSSLSTPAPPYEKSELIPHRECVRIFHFYQGYFLLMIAENH